MNTVFWLTVVAVIIHGLIAGISFDVATVKLPTRKRIGAVAYTHFARANDMGNGILVYPTIAIIAFALIASTTIAACFAHAPRTIMLPLLVSCVGTVAHSLCTAKAAPNMLGLRQIPDDEIIMGSKLDEFAKWHAYRAAFQFLTFVALVWALVAICQ